MNSVRIDRSNPDVVDVVLREEVGPLVFAARRWPGEVVGSLAAGALYGTPVYAVMAVILEQGPGRIWAAVGIAAAVGLVVNTFAILYGAFRSVTRLRFSPAAAPNSMTLVRGPRTDRPRPLTDVQQIWIDHTIVESHKRDRKPVSAKITLYVLLKNNRLIRPMPILPWTTDTTPLHQQLQQALAPTSVQVDLVVRRRVQSPPWMVVGHGGSTGGGG
ncbi:hypothetical protein [Streptomyces virginiae]|uniref:hypothetical protein n=1 Tax=Streptomyces virginiae TaxID=1961 RepID=UPI00224CB9AE|nr:hypothetical protein [Streptomyces virginiae]MCX5174759.1 hypothetical protein [Streptomyces virginiae]